MTFEEKIQKRLQETILSQIGDCRYIDYNYHKKLVVPEEFIEKAWQGINWDEVIEYVKTEMQNKVCQTIVQHMLTEVKTDVKALLSIRGMREKIRMEVYPNLKKAIDIGGKI